jgi:GNAT superfamily N-acetyltransferase
VSELRIIEALDENETGLVALIEPIFNEYPGVLFVMEEMPELRCVASTFVAAGGAFWCAFRGERLVGCVGFTPAKEPGGVELKKLYVAKSERKSGLGSRLTELVENAARGADCGFVELWSDVKFKTAHRFYEGRGYLRDGRTRELHDMSDTVEHYLRRELTS